MQRHRIFPQKLLLAAILLLLALGQWKPVHAQTVIFMNSTVDQAKRKELYAKVQDAAVADLPVIVIQEAPQASLVKPNVTGWEINALGMVIVRGASLSQ